MKPIIELVKDNDSTIFVMSLNISDLDTYSRAKAIDHFIYKDTKVLEIALENHLRDILRGYGIIPYDGSESALQEAFDTLKSKGIELEIRDRYYELYNERIIALSPNQMTVILESDNILSCAMEIIVNGNDTHN